MLKTLIGRNILFLVTVLLLGQLLAGALTVAFVLRPQAHRAAEVIANIVNDISAVYADLPPEAQAGLVERFNHSPTMQLRSVDQGPPTAIGRPTLLERAFMRGLVEQLDGQEDVVWQVDDRNRIWLELTLGDTPYWFTLTATRLRSPLTTLAVTLSVAFVLALAGGLFMQRLVDRPLRRLSQDVDRIDGPVPSDLIAEQGPVEIASVARSFNRMVGRLIEAEADRSLMLAGVSHDLRTPLAKLRLSLAIMEKDCDAELVATSNRQIDEMDSMLGQFIDFARGFEAEELEIVELEPFLRDILANLIDQPRPTLTVKTRLTVLARPIALRRAVINLLANAQSHGASPIALDARRDADTIVIAVSDAGPGIADEAWPNLLRPFARADEARSSPGTGLGLAIVNRIAKAHGGTMRCVQMDGRCIVEIRLPIRCS